MKKCKKCGRQLENDAMFCSFCGTKVDDESNNVINDHHDEEYCFKCGHYYKNTEAECPYCKEEKEGKSGNDTTKVNNMKCPNCGAAIGPLDSRCPSCHITIKRGDSKKIFEDFEKKLNKASSIDERVNAINLLDVKVDTETLVKLLSLCESNIQVDCYVHKDQHSDEERRECDAWRKKYEDVFNGANVTNVDKGKISSINDEYKKKIEKIEESKKIIDNVNRKQAKNKALVKGIAVVFAVIVIGGVSYGIKGYMDTKNEKIAKLEEKLVSLRDETNDNIESGNLNQAKLTALEIKGDEKLDKKQANKWEGIREDLIDEINNKLILIYNEKMNELVNKTYEYIANGDYVNAKATATKVKGDEVITPSDSTKWEETREVLFRAITDAENDVYNKYINDLVQEVNNLYNNKQYDKAKEVASQIHGNEDTSSASNENYIRIRDDLLKKIKDAENEIYVNHINDLIVQANDLLNRKQFAKAKEIASQIRGNDNTSKLNNDNWDKAREDLIKKIEHAEFIAKGNIMVGSSSAELKNKYYSTVVKALKAAGFTKVTAKELGDLPLGTTEGVGLVESVFIGSTSNFSKQDYFNKNTEVFVNYHTAYDDGKLEVGVTSDSLVGEHYSNVIKVFEKAGFRNIKTKKLNDLVMGFMAKEYEVETVSIDGLTIFDKHDRFDKNADIVISYHTFEDKKEENKNTEVSSIKVGYNANDCIGKDYASVKDDLINAGFNNIETIPVADGKGGFFGNINEISYISINGDTTFTKSQKFDKNSNIMIKYHVEAVKPKENIKNEVSGIEAGYDASNLIDENYEKVIDKLSGQGFRNIRSETVADAVDKFIGGNVDKVFEVSIDGNTDFSKNDRFDSNAVVIIKYHVLSEVVDNPTEKGGIEVGYDVSKLIDENYQNVGEKLAKKGFTNINYESVYDAVDKFIGGNVDKVFNVSINGINDFSKTDRFDANSKIVISYHVLAENIDNTNTIEVGYDSSKLVDENYEKVIDKLTKAGFRNIRSETTADAVDKFIGGNVDEVFEVAIGDVTEFSKSDKFSPNIEVVIKYHVLP